MRLNKGVIILIFLYFLDVFLFLLWFFNHTYFWPAVVLAFVVITLTLLNSNRANWGRFSYPDQRGPVGTEEMTNTGEGAKTTATDDVGAPGMGFEPMGSQGAPVFKTGAVSWLGYPGPERLVPTRVNLYRPSVRALRTL
jgi:hypothetical protein